MKTLTYCERCSKPAKGAHRLYCGKVGVDVPRFWAKIDKRPDGCWLWTRGKYNHGYGSVVWRFKPNGRGKMIAASRAAWMVARGPIPAGQQVLHKCDVPACCNPEHLFLGTITDNMHDMRLKERDPRVTLTIDAVREIRVALASNDDQASIAAKYGVKPHVIRSLASGRTFRYVK